VISRNISIETIKTSIVEPCGGVLTIWHVAWQHQDVFNYFLKDIIMKHSNIKLAHLSAAIILTFCSFGVYAAENQDAAPVNKDQVEGRVDEATGKVKEATGVILDDKGMQIEGNIQKNVGKVQKGYGDLKQDIQKGK
jgi:uncharacterized protein YjbJ (UPF0337 family)